MNEKLQLSYERHVYGASDSLLTEDVRRVLLHHHTDGRDTVDSSCCHEVFNTPEDRSAPETSQTRSVRYVRRQQAAQRTEDSSRLNHRGELFSSQKHTHLPPLQRVSGTPAAHHLLL